MARVILVTGGAGYIGSHTCVELLNSGCEVVVLDDLQNSSEISLQRVQRITGGAVEFNKVDMRDRPAVERVLSAHSYFAVIHFAGLKAVGESVAKPLAYYDNNIIGTVNLMECMAAAGVKNLVFSSSATVYGDPAKVPVTEDMPLSATNPYGRTKLFIEEICRDTCKSEASWKVILLRYFNPVGAHPSGLIGEDPRGAPNNLMPYLMQVAVGRRPFLSVYGNDYPTPDGTGVRDYIHVVDLAQGHVKALDAIAGVAGCTAINLGTGRGYSVLDLVKAASKAVGKEMPVKMAPRRPGDIATTYADPSLAAKLLGWKASRGLDEMCADSWRWQSQNPEGYATPRPDLK